MKRIHSFTIIHPASLLYWTERTYQFSKWLLWKNSVFTIEEINEAKKFIEIYYAQTFAIKFSKTAKFKFYKFCLKLILYKIDFRVRKMSSPVTLFDPQQPKGLLFRNYPLFISFQDWQICQN